MLEPEYIRWLHEQPCAARTYCRDCDGPVEAHHAGERGLSQRAPDATAIPLCRRHHREPGFTVLEPWLSWGKALRRVWVNTVIALHRERWMRELVLQSAQGAA